MVAFVHVFIDCLQSFKLVRYSSEILGRDSECVYFLSHSDRVNWWEIRFELLQRSSVMLKTIHCDNKRQNVVQMWKCGTNRKFMLYEHYACRVAAHCVLNHVNIVGYSILWYSCATKWHKINRVSSCSNFIPRNGCSRLRFFLFLYRFDRATVVSVVVRSEVVPSSLWGCCCCCCLSLG
jgi:hypothetical protein